MTQSPWSAGRRCGARLGLGRPVQSVGEWKGPSPGGVQAETHLTTVGLHQRDAFHFGLYQDLEAVFTLWLGADRRLRLIPTGERPLGEMLQLSGPEHIKLVGRQENKSVVPGGLAVR